jgi:hypothetical protein
VEKSGGRLFNLTARKCGEVAKIEEDRMSFKFRGVGIPLLGAFFAAILMNGSASGQVQDGNLVGSILDPTGAAIPVARVEAENTATGVKTTTNTDANGFYRLNNLLIGTYRVTVSAAGLSPSARDVVVEANKTSTANVTLALGGVTQEIQVTESDALVDTTTAQITNTYSTQMVADLPLAANLVAGGVWNLTLAGAGVTSAGGLGAGTGPSVGGQRPRNNNFMVDGTDNNRKDVTGPIVDIPIDAIKEFAVLQNQFIAEFGHSSGGQFNAILTSGGNEVHGTAYEYFQNRNLNAVDQSAKRQGTFSNPRYDQNIVGAGVGGPIIKNKLFYFGNFDYNPLGQASVPGSLRFAPTAEGFTTLAAIPGLSQTNLNILTQYVTPAANSTKTTPVQGTDGIIRNIPLGPFRIVAPNYQNEYRWVGTVDYNMSDRNQWRWRYVDNKLSTIDTTANLPVFFQPRPLRKALTSISEFHTFSPSLVNEFRLNYNRYTDHITVGDFTYPGLDTFPNLLIAGDLNLQIGPNPTGPQATIQNTYQLIDNLNWIKGQHDWKFGFDGRKLIAETAFIMRIRGDYDYNNLDRFLRDVTPDVLAQRSVGSKLYVGNDSQFYFYGNDNWKVNRNLTLNLGLRYEFTTVPRSMREFELNSLADVPGVITFRAPQPQKTNFAPRVGFAYSPGNSASTSIRGGFGIAYDQIFDNVGTTTRPPQATSTVDLTNANNNTGFLAAGGISPNAVAPALTPAAARAATSGYLPDQKLGYAINWNFGVQQVFAKDYTAEVRYLGNRGVHLLFQQQINRNAVVTASNNLPLFFSQPSQATLDALPLTLDQLTTERDSALGNPLLPYGFPLPITAYEPLGNSKYHGLALDLNKRYTRHLLLKAGYTWSHLTDDSTAELNSTALSPRRAEDFGNIRKEWANSLLDRRHRISLAWDYDTPWLAGSSNLVLKKLVGSWRFSGAYFYESPEYVTPQSVLDANLNTDTAGDRVVINKNGTPGTSSDITALTSLRNGSTRTVAYLVTNPNAYYIRARAGVYTTSGRNILPTRPIDNFDLSFGKEIPFKERYKIQLRLDMYNAFNHPQYTPGRIDRVNSFIHSGETNYLTPGNPVFAQWDQVFPSNARQLQLTAKVNF